MNPRTELDFTERNLPEHTKHLSLMLLSGILIAYVISVCIILVILNAEFLDNLRPEHQMAIVVFLCGAFGVIRFIIWLRNL